jgi:hypothetical protein
MCYAQRLHATPSYLYLVLYMLLHASACCSCPTHAPLFNQELQQVFIDKHLQGTTPIPTFKEVVGHYLTHVHPWT